MAVFEHGTALMTVGLYILYTRWALQLRFKFNSLPYLDIRSKVVSVFFTVHMNIINIFTRFDCVISGSTRPKPDKKITNKINN